VFANPVVSLHRPKNSTGATLSLIQRDKYRLRDVSSESLELFEVLRDDVSPAFASSSFLSVANPATGIVSTIHIGELGCSDMLKRVSVVMNPSPGSKVAFDDIVLLPLKNWLNRPKQSGWDKALHYRIDCSHNSVLAPSSLHGILMGKVKSVAESVAKPILQQNKSCVPLQSWNGIRMREMTHIFTYRRNGIEQT
jgi:hypothetical protein